MNFVVCWEMWDEGSQSLAVPQVQCLYVGNFCGLGDANFNRHSSAIWNNIENLQKKQFATQENFTGNSKWSNK